VLRRPVEITRDKRKFLVRPAQLFDRFGIGKFTVCLIGDCHGVAHFSAIKRNKCVPNLSGTVGYAQEQKE
jgi:hypothetical protein